MLGSLADESALLTTLRGLLASGRYVDVANRLAALPPEVTGRAPFALLAAEAAGRLGRLAEAEGAAATALTAARAGAERTTEARAWNIRGAVALERGDTAAAAEYFAQALAAARAAGHAGIAARALNNLGIVADLRGDYSGALANYELALAAYQQAGETPGIVETHHNIAITRRHLGDLAGALGAADQALRLAADMRNDNLMAQLLLGRAETHLAQGDAGLAAAEIARARAQYERLDHPVGLAEALRLEAAVAAASGAVTRAAEILARAAGLAEHRGSAHTLAEITRDLASVLDRLSDAAGARAARTRAAELYRRLGATDRAAQVEGSPPT
jgi:tetratricopeptide (TPR) repeat protein